MRGGRSVLRAQVCPALTAVATAALNDATFLKEAVTLGWATS